MRDAAKTSLISLGSAVLAIAAYHLLRSSPADAPLDRDRQALETEVASLRQDFDRFRKQLMADLDARFLALANRPGTVGTPATPNSVVGSAGGSPRPTTSSESARVAEFRSLLEEIEKTRERERDEATWRRRLKNASIFLAVAQEDEFVTAAAAYQESVRNLFPGGSGGSTIAEREATLAKMEELRGALLEKLRSRIEGLSAEDLEKMFPPAPTKPPERNVPVDPSAMDSR